MRSLSELGAREGTRAARPRPHDEALCISATTTSRPHRAAMLSEEIERAIRGYRANSR